MIKRTQFYLSVPKAISFPCFFPPLFFLFFSLLFLKRSHFNVFVARVTETKQGRHKRREDKRNGRHFRSLSGCQRRRRFPTFWSTVECIGWSGSSKTFIFIFVRMSLRETDMIFLGISKKGFETVQSTVECIDWTGSTKTFIFLFVRMLLQEQIGSFLECRREVSKLYKAMWNVLTDQFIRKHLYCYRKPFCTLLGCRRRVSKLYKAPWNVLTDQYIRKHLYFSSYVCCYRKQICSLLIYQRRIFETL